MADLFGDPLGWIVPASVPLGDIKQALARKGHLKGLSSSLRAYVEVDANSSLKAQSDEWYRHTLPGSTPSFTANTYATAVDLVAEGLATTHSPLSLVPCLAPDTREKIRIFPIEELTRSVVLVMPKHLYTLPSYANVFRRIVEFCRNDYNREMLVGEAVALPLAG
jgi:DNA-binding transcriptional LysR family regulator